MKRERKRLLRLSLLMVGGLLFFSGGEVKAKKDLFFKLGIEKFSPPQEIKEFVLKDLEGKKVSLKRLKGKVVFLNFWTTWCPACRAEMPSMQKLWERYKKKNFVILAVNLREKKEKIISFMKKEKYTFPVLIDSKGKVGKAYGIRAIPTTFIINPQGKIVGKAVGARNWASKESFELVESLFEKTFGSSLTSQ